MADCLMPTYDPLPVHISRGDGVYLYDEKGQPYLDTFSGLGVTILGHNHPQVRDTLIEQSQMLIHTSNALRHAHQSTLAETLCGLTGLQRAFIGNSGTEASELAIKLAMLHGRQRGIPAPKIVVLNEGFHGRTYGAMSGSMVIRSRPDFAPLLDDFISVPQGDQAALQALADTRNDIVAIWLEPITGSSGVRIPPPDYLMFCRQLCDQNDWLFMADEIQCGLGRTGAFLECLRQFVQPDVVTLAKGLGNGLPIGACLTTDTLGRQVTVGRHGTTFGGNPLCTRVAQTVMDIVQGDSLAERAVLLGDRIQAQLRESIGTHPAVQAIRGQGLMIGVALSRPLPELKTLGLSEGLLLNITGNPPVLRLLPAFIFSEADIDTLVSKLTRVFEQLPSEDS